MPEAQTFEALLGRIVEQAVERALSRALAGREEQADGDALLAPREVAELIGGSVSGARALLRNELGPWAIVMPGTGAGIRAQRRVRRADLLAWLQRQREESR